MLMDDCESSEIAREPRPYDAGYVSPSKAKAFASAHAQPAPVVILMRPYDPGNIGSASRAMLNFGITELRVVSPHHPLWNEGEAISRACGAVNVLKQAVKYNSLSSATADLVLVFATTARPRDMSIVVSSPQEAAAEAATVMRGGSRVGFLFGSEKSGLTNEDLALANVLVTIPSEPNFSSLNLAHSVLLISYEWSLAAHRSSLSGRITTRLPSPARAASMPLSLAEAAPQGQLSSLFAFWEGALWKTRFFGKTMSEASRQAVSAAIEAGEEPQTLVGEDESQAKALLAEQMRACKTMMKLRRLLMRSQPTQEEVKLLRGALKALLEPKETRPPRTQPMFVDGEGTPECGTRLQRRQLQNGGEEVAWVEEWHARFDCWWRALPLLTRRKISTCIGALALHLSGRFEAAWHHLQATSGRLPITPFPRNGVAEQGCEWMDAGSFERTLELPEFPPLGERFELEVLPIPRLIPPILHQLHTLGSLQPTPTPLIARTAVMPSADIDANADTVAGGAAIVTFAASAVIYFIFYPMRSGTRSAWRWSAARLSGA